MLDIQVQWLLVCAANFLALIFILNMLLYKPLLKIFGERENSVKASLEAAKDMNTRKEDGIVRMNKEIAEARTKAKEAFEAMRDEGLNVQQLSLTEAETKATAMIQKAREELKAEVERARQALKADVEKFSDEIVGKLVKA